MAEPPPRGELGCAGMLAILNVLVLGFLAFTLGRLGEPDILSRIAFSAYWIGLFVTGGLAPVIALVTFAQRSRQAVIGLTLWMLIALVLTLGFAVNSGGGV